MKTTTRRIDWIKQEDGTYIGKCQSGHNYLMSANQEWVEFRAVTTDIVTRAWSADEAYRQALAIYRAQNADKRDYCVEFNTIEKHSYSVSVTAESPEEALEKAMACPSEYEWQEEGYEGCDETSNFKVVGYWCPDGSNSSSLNRFEKPVKVNEEPKIEESPSTSYYQINHGHGHISADGYSKYNERLTMASKGEIPHSEVYGLEQVREHAEELRNHNSPEYSRYWKSTPLTIVKKTVITQSVEVVTPLGHWCIMKDDAYIKEDGEVLKFDNNYDAVNKAKLHEAEVVFIESN